MSDQRFVRKNPDPVPLDTLKEPDWDVREYRTDEDINNIAETMDQKGQVMPILLGQQQNGQYPVLDGNHRVLAARRLGWPNIDAIQTASGTDNNEVQIVANISRLELTHREKLSTFDFMLNNLGWSQARAAREVGWDRSQVHRYAKILEGYGEIKEFFMREEIGVQAAYELNKGLDRDQAVDIAERAVREGYVDADIVEQARNRRGEEDADDVMRGAGGDTNIQNMQQVKRNAQELGDLKDIDSEGVREAQVAPDGQQGAGQPEGGGQPQQQPQGPPCHGCGDAMAPAPLSQVTIHPELAQKLQVEEILFCGSCTGELIDWWSKIQSGKAEELSEAEDGQS